MHNCYRQLNPPGDIELFDVGQNHSSLFFESYENFGQLSRVEVSLTYHNCVARDSRDAEVSPEDGGGYIRAVAYYQGPNNYIATCKFSKIPVQYSFREYANLTGGIMINVSDNNNNIIHSFIHPYNVKCTIPKNKLQCVEIRLLPYDLFNIFGCLLPAEICSHIESMRRAAIINEFSRHDLSFPHTTVIISTAPTAGASRLKQILAQDIKTPFAVSPKLFLRSKEEAYENAKTIKSILVRLYRFR